MHELKDLILFDLSKRHTRELAHLAQREKHILKELWGFALSDEEPLNWRSAWVLKGIHENDPGLIEPLVPDMIRALPELKKEGVKREFLRMIMEYPLPDVEERLGILLDTCFRWLSEPAEPIAVKVHCMTLLFEICKIIPEIKQELITTIEVAMTEGSAGIVNRGSKTIRALKLGRARVT